ncbi:MULTISPECIES: inositol monophosphatase family protein [Pseudomonas syringae group]|uniref:inositol monophosphatase family protein n=1 Tax=Pseudomonas syringae group TaxID=136849 RepID=UPI000D223DE6|nr:hypothetical protein XJ28_10350 [Pseudomonas syringae pv. tomato]
MSSLELRCDWWGEETGHVLTRNDRCWVVDPNDGTSDFLKGLNVSAISVGLLHLNRPVLDVVHAPVTPEGRANCISWAEGMAHLLRNGAPLHVDLSDSHRRYGCAWHALGGTAVVNQALSRTGLGPSGLHPHALRSSRSARSACVLDELTPSLDIPCGYHLLASIHRGVRLRENGMVILEGQASRVGSGRGASIHQCS